MSNDRPGRLPSLRGPRDLTLGGVRKKTFAPKIPVRKDRSKKEKPSDQSEAKPKQNFKRERQRGRGRGRGHGRPEIIQSHSIFEAGPSAEPATKRSDSGFGTGGGGGGGGAPAKDAIEKPSIKHEIFDEDLEKSKTEEALKNLEAASDFIEDLESDDTLLPTCLPMRLSSWPPGSSKQSKDVKSTIAQDPNAIAGINCASIFTNNEGLNSNEVYVFQLPDTLPIIPPSSDDDVKSEPNTKIKQESGVKIKQEPETEVDAKPDNCTLDQLPEGFVGKLQIMKSGRSRLIMGGIVLDVNVGTPASFLEELVSIHLPPSDEESSYGDIAVLGNISHKIICSPNMEYLIKESKKQIS